MALNACITYPNTKNGSALADKAKRILGDCTCIGMGYDPHLDPELATRGESYVGYEAIEDFLNHQQFLLTLAFLFGTRSKN